MGMRVTARKWPSTVEPAISIRTMQAVRSDSDRDLTNPRRPIPRCATASRITAKVPTLPASVGVKKPFIRPADDQDEHEQDPDDLGQRGEALLPGRPLPLGPEGGVDAAPDDDGQGEAARR